MKQSKEIIEDYQEYYYTINPHRVNLSIEKLIKTFRFCLQQYYKSIYGRRYNKRKDEQFEITIFTEYEKPYCKENLHLHNFIKIPNQHRHSFLSQMKLYLEKQYPTISIDCKVIENKADRDNLISYSNKNNTAINLLKYKSEPMPIFYNKDLWYSGYN